MRGLEQDRQAGVSFRYAEKSRLFKRNFALISGALTDEINDREMFMKGIDYSYYYEAEG